MGVEEGSGPPTRAREHLIAPEELARVLGDVGLADLAHPARGDQGALEGLGRAHARARAGGGGEEENALNVALGAAVRLWSARWE